jgi:hypothetical protein
MNFASKGMFSPASILSFHFMNVLYATPAVQAVIESRKAKLPNIVSIDRISIISTAII